MTGPFDKIWRLIFSGSSEGIKHRRGETDECHERRPGESMTSRVCSSPCLPKYICGKKQNKWQTDLQFRPLLLQTPPRFSALIYWSRPRRSICSNFKDARRNTINALTVIPPLEFPQSLGKKNPRPVQEAWLVSYSLHCHSAIVSAALYDEILDGSGQQLAFLCVSAIQPRFWMFDLVWIVTAAHFNNLAVPTHLTPGVT